MYSSIPNMVVVSSSKGETQVLLQNNNFNLILTFFGVCIYQKILCTLLSVSRFITPIFTFKTCRDLAIIGCVELDLHAKFTLKRSPKERGESGVPIRYNLPRNSVEPDNLGSIYSGQCRYKIGRLNRYKVHQFYQHIDSSEGGKCRTKSHIMQCHLHSSGGNDCCKPHGL